MHEFLPKTVGQETVTKILTEGRKFYNWRNLPFIPVEFSVAAYRFGHSQVHPSYRANFEAKADDSEQFIALIFDDGRPTSPDPSDPDPNDLRGGKRAKRRFIDWQTFFEFGDGRSRPNKALDTTLSSAYRGCQAWSHNRSPSETCCGTWLFVYLQVKVLLKQWVRHCLIQRIWQI